MNTFARQLQFFGVLTVTLLGASSASASITLYSNGFETDTDGWLSAPTRVASLTNGITSAAGSFHAQTAANQGDYTAWGGYNYGAGNAVPTVFKEYTTSIDIYLDVEGGWANRTRFDFDSAINNSTGSFQRDYIFNAAFHNDATGPGAGTNRFVISVGNNSQAGSAYAKDPNHDPIAISTSGWYTFQNHFYDNGGFLAVDMSILDSSNNLVNDWSSTDNPGVSYPRAGEAISTVGGNRYGWFDVNEFSFLAIDNAKLTVEGNSPVPEPMSLVVWSALATTIGGAVCWRQYKLAG